ncbi:hypothetical protein [Actinomycetospora cinnamomea]|uniref:hypothetical protein n=1 Tax=Actinomycetospora cinnamomea TaxID=663609 RepID=UPI000E30C192|nr:hypothetical protein [Actinomycetospora cinnamomea]
MAGSAVLDDLLAELTPARRAAVEVATKVDTVAGGRRVAETIGLSTATNSSPPLTADGRQQDSQ